MNSDTTLVITLALAAGATGTVAYRRRSFVYVFSCVCILASLAVVLLR